MSDIPETMKAYAAGFFDGEGCISISKNGTVDVRITNTAFNVLSKIQEYFGGTITNRSQKVNKRQYAYSFYGENAINFLTVVKPYLIEKLPQAETVFEYFYLRNQVETIRIPGTRGSHSNPDREILIETFREVLSEQKREEH